MPDVADDADCVRAVGDCIARYGRLDVLVANAGISHRSAFASTDAAVIRRVMEVNFFGAVNCTRAALPHLRSVRGAIVAVSSVAGYSPLVARTGYAASKHALHGFYDSLRAELAEDGVDVTLVCPSFVATGIGRNALGGDGREALVPEGDRQGGPPGEGEFPGGGRFRGGPPGEGGRPDFNPEEFRARFEEMRKEREKIRSTATTQINAVLSAEQQAAFKKLQGKPFDLASLRPGPGPGGPPRAGRQTNRSRAQTKARSGRGAAPKQESGEEPEF